jgi:hypothetical protein
MDTNAIKLLADWVKYLMTEAEKDTNLSVSQYQAAGADDSPFTIAGGWSEGFSEDYADLLYVSKSEPKYAMCIKIALKSDDLCIDFDSLNMPTYKHGEVDDTCVPLELEDDPEAVAAFFLMEFERITKEYDADLYDLY